MCMKAYNIVFRSKVITASAHKNRDIQFQFGSWVWFELYLLLGGDGVIFNFSLLLRDTSKMYETVDLYRTFVKCKFEISFCCNKN